MKSKVLIPRLVIFSEQMCIYVKGGGVSNIWPIYFGHVGQKNTCIPCKQEPSGIIRKETWNLAISFLPELSEKPFVNDSRYFGEV